MKIAFYNVDLEYIDYLKQYETSVRGFTRVPNVNYRSGNNEAVTTSFSMGRFSTLIELTTLYLYHQNNTIDRTIYKSNQKTINTVMSMQH